ncbi:MAG TPA: cation:proton antiporter [Candidatus Limnocylindrales bacterium]|nr:cation:proton antiporter [Candidatus Limnocylindrales bacterium]
MEQTLFFQLSMVIAVAAIVSLIFRQFRQPSIIAYIVTGFLAGPSLLNLIHDHEAFTSFSQIGISLLLFVIGLGLNAQVIRTTGKPVFLAFSAVTASVGGVTYGLARLLGFTTTEAIILAVALLFSSTIVVIKALSDKKEQARLYAQIAIGILLVEDIIATVALVVLSAQGGGDSAASGMWLLLAKGLVLGTALTIFGAYVLPRTVSSWAASQELLFIFALAWAFGVASVFHWYGFSLEVGALFAGVAIAHLPYAQEISTRLKPLRDFFIVLFFVELGQNMNLDNVSAAIIPALVFSAMVMLIKPLSVMTSLGLLGYTKQTGFKAAVHLSQISEFSIIFVVLAVSTGVASERVTAVITLTAVITIVLSAYLMKYDDRLYKRFKKPLSVFERADTKHDINDLHSYPLVLLGYRKGGHEFVRTFREMRRRYVVIDYDPDVIDTLEHQHVNHLYGDVTDLELLEEISLHKSELVVSTVTDKDANVMLAKHITKQNKQAIFICHANSYDDAAELYERGASYVLLPHLIGSEQVSAFIRRNGNNSKAFADYRKKHLDLLKNV